MNDVVSFDTHRFVKRLVATGMDETTAEVLADEHVNLLNSNLATKQNLKQTEAELTFKIEKVRAELTVEIEKVRTDLTVEIRTIKAELLKWMIGSMIALAGLLITVIKFL